MAYTIDDIQEQLSIVSEDIEKYIIQKKIKVGKDGSISQKSYQILLELLSPQEAEGKLTLSTQPHKNQYNFLPYFETQDKRVSICQNDAISFLKDLPTNSVDVIITDPAYSGMNQKMKFGKGKIIGKYADAGKTNSKWFQEFHDTEENYITFLRECHRVLKKNRHIYIMFDSYSLLSLAPIARKIFEVKNIICWDKANIGLGHYFRRRHEFILFASKGKRALNQKNIPDVWKIKRIVSAKYPTQKPTELFELMLKGSAEKDFVVCDPFIGSGSSAIASLKASCKFLGCDISDKALSFSKERIEVFLTSKTDVYQINSAISDDVSMKKILFNGQLE